MAGKAVISLTTGLEDPEKVTVAFLVAVGAAEAGGPTLIVHAKEGGRRAPAGGAERGGWRGLPAAAGPAGPVRKGRGHVHGVPGVLQRQAAGQGRPDPERRTGRQRPAVGVDRRRGRDHLQLLTVRPPPAHAW